MAGNDTLEQQHICAGCQRVLPFTDFHARSNRRLGRASKCKACESTRRREFNKGTVEKRKAKYEANRQDILDAQRFATYGITREQYDEMHRQQGGVCACCGQPERTLNRRGEVRALAVDHDHSCCPGKRSCGRCVRGLLCHSCNIGLGVLGDSPEMLMKAVAYLIAHEAGTTQGSGSDRR